jgi:hypothetical protein
MARQGVSGGHVPKAVNKPALDNNNCSINPSKFISGPYSGNSQGISATAFVVDQQLINSQENEQADLSNFHVESMKSTVGCSES